jgi:hypothetical protein
MIDVMSSVQIFYSIVVCALSLEPRQKSLSMLLFGEVLTSRGVSASFALNRIYHQALVDNAKLRQQLAMKVSFSLSFSDTFHLVTRGPV